MLGVQTTAIRTGCAMCERRGINCNNPRKDCSTQPNQRNGLKLSWPRANDTRRSVVLKASQPTHLQGSAPPISDASFVHTSSWDMELYHSLSSSASVHDSSKMRVPLPWTGVKLETPERELIEYSSASLATFGYDAMALGNILV
ncbi:predicted protein [Pyrenophora tritici-repentis Pt-1C-BFP]|uniref:Zn(2)-C6 fungal-type domain-containing protein n=1 Tax=Pyrenophora tritici-repentis (strain Pt-1C-BFP) TaxID=426418 RepID=B2WA06_PYRTR|nr:uncharacterized protein PTRG_06814 [Pyrenophora tritici-repentis Pt-1C-BFP]EDU49734.1 predicted protein [Pyrenophora tritici-repentis Pt-1C-BFP]